LQKSLASPVPSSHASRSTAGCLLKNQEPINLGEGEQDCKQKKSRLELHVGDFSEVFIPILINNLKIIFCIIKTIWFNLFIYFVLMIIFVQCLAQSQMWNFESGIDKQN
jgi:hypothetical protein